MSDQQSLLVVERILLVETVLPLAFVCCHSIAAIEHKLCTDREAQ